MNNKFIEEKHIQYFSHGRRFERDSGLPKNLKFLGDYLTKLAGKVTLVIGERFKLQCVLLLRQKYGVENTKESFQEVNYKTTFLAN